MAESVNTPQAATGRDIPFRVITPDDVRASIKRAKGSLEKAAEEIVWQVEMEGWKTLGYKSWDAFREAEYGGAAFMVPAKQRPELVARMRATGLTQQEVADTAGVTTKTIKRDEHPEWKGTNVPSGQAGATKPPRRYPLPDSYWRAVYDLNKAVERVKRLHEDDRFLTNREALHKHNGGDIDRASALLHWIERDLEDCANKCQDCEARIEANWSFESRCKACREESA